MNRFLAAERALRTAEPHRLLDAVRTVLAERYGAGRVELLLADYGLTRLQPFRVPLGDTAWDAEGADAGGAGAGSAGAGSAGAGSAGTGGAGAGGAGEEGLPPADPASTDPASEGLCAPVAAHNSAAGRAFGAQEPVAEPLAGGLVRLHLPVTVRGERLGVLAVDLPGAEGTRELVDELCEVAQVLGHELVVAERDTDLYRRARRLRRLTLAAEMQWQLLPGRSCSRSEFRLGAHLAPAYAACDGAVDWSADPDRLTLHVTQGMGDPSESAVLTGLTVGALRNARRAGVPIVDQAALAGQAVYAHYRGARYACAALLDIDLATGTVQAVDAGSPQVLRVRGGEVRSIRLEAQLPLGMFEDTEYEVQEFTLEPGDRLVCVSENLRGHEPDKALARAIAATRLLPAAEVPSALLRELAAAGGRTAGGRTAGGRTGGAGGNGGRAAADEGSTVVCLDWLGRG